MYFAYSNLSVFALPLSTPWNSFPQVITVAYLLIEAFHKQVFKLSVPPQIPFPASFFSIKFITI